ENLGIPRPPAIPMLYRIAAARATTAPLIEALGERTSGEVEFVLLKAFDRLWISVGSDHTDREVEAQNAALSKQACDKPICRQFWALDDIEKHWDQLRLRSFVTTSDGTRQAYQDGSVSSMLEPRKLLGMWEAADTLQGNTLLFCGTLATIGPIRSACGFHIELEDPVLKRCLSHSYQVNPLPSHLA